MFVYFINIIFSLIYIYMSLYGLGIARKHYMTQDAATNAIKKQEGIIKRLTEHTNELKLWHQGWESEKRPKITRIKKAAKTEIKKITDDKKKQKKKLLKQQIKKKNKLKVQKKTKLKK